MRVVTVRVAVTTTTTPRALRGARGETAARRSVHTPVPRGGDRRPPAVMPSRVGGLSAADKGVVGGGFSAELGSAGFGHRDPGRGDPIGGVLPVVERARPEQPRHRRPGRGRQVRRHQPGAHRRSAQIRATRARGGRRCGRAAFSRRHLRCRDGHQSGCRGRNSARRDSNATTSITPTTATRAPGASLSRPSSSSAPHGGHDTCAAVASAAQQRARFRNLPPRPGSGYLTWIHRRAEGV